MSRVIILGIDGFDKVLINRFIDHMPTLKKIIDQSPHFNVTSTFPPDSDTAWASIYTGLNPAQHGVVQFVDPLEKSWIYQSKDSLNENIRGKTFWDYLGRIGKKVCVITPHLGYPVWEVNGIMIGRSSINDIVQVYPENSIPQSDLEKLNTIKGFPGTGGLSYFDFVSKHKELLHYTLELSSKLLEENDWDLFFVYSSILDVVPHFFWKYYDKEDPSYPGKNQYENCILDLYKLHDDFISFFYNKLNKNDVLIILSDHGHGKRPHINININKLLYEAGYLKIKKGKIFTSFSDNLKNQVLNIIGRYNLENIASNILKVMPNLRQIYTAPINIDLENTIAYVTDLSGIKSYSYGGIKINKNKCHNYKFTREDIINQLKNISNFENYFVWIKKREELYTGIYIDKYPDIVIKLQHDYGVGNQIKSLLIKNTQSHSIVPGTHIAENAVFYIVSNRNINYNKNLTLIDVNKMILNILNFNV